MDTRIIQRLISDAKKNKSIMDKKVAELEKNTFQEEVKDHLTLSMNGKFELLSCKVSDQLLSDKEMLESLLLDLFNKLVQQIKKEHEKINAEFLPSKFF